MRQPGRTGNGFAGETFRSDRIVLAPGKSTDYKKQRGIFNRLKAHKAKGKSLPAYVNPANPTQAVLFRSISWMMRGFMIIIGLVAFGLALGAAWSGFRYE